MRTYDQFVMFNFIIVALMTVAYFYQAVYMFVGWKKRKAPELPAARVNHRYAAFISARNERGVIGELIDSLMKQNYPKDLFDVYVLADNCTDDTAEVSRQHGAAVYERFDKQNVGKGYALDYLYKHVTMDRGVGYYDGFFVFDADNIVDPQFVAEMNKTFDTGRFDAVTCYRNSKNFGTNWLSAAYSIWFLREARYVNYPRMLLGTSCMISGTGFLVSGKLMEENHGWPYHLLTEDIQFSVNCALNGHLIGYCDKAMVYDEQPTTWSQSWKQRLRWSKGFYQIDGQYTLPLIKTIFSGRKNAASAYDALMTVLPAMLLTIAVIGLNAYAVFAALTMPYYVALLVQREALRYLFFSVVNYYLGMIIISSLTVATEWDRIPCTSWEKLKYLWIFPLFIASYIPITLQALHAKVEWTPIQHNSVEQLAMAESHHR